MAFTTEPTLTPQSIRHLNIHMSTDGISQEVNFNVQIVMNDGNVKVRRGDLEPHLTSAQITQLQTFLASMWIKAEAEILP